MGKSTISITIFNSFLYVYQRVKNTGFLEIHIVKPHVSAVQLQLHRDHPNVWSEAQRRRETGDGVRLSLAEIEFMEHLSGHWRSMPMLQALGFFLAG